MEKLTVKIQPRPLGDLAWVFSGGQFIFTPEVGANYRTALKRVAQIDLSLAVPYGVVNTDHNRMLVDFEDEYIYTPYSSALKGLRDLDLINDETLIRFHGFERRASLVFREITTFEKNEILSKLERDLDWTFNSWGMR